MAEPADETADQSPLRPELLEEITAANPDGPDYGATELDELLGVLVGQGKLTYIEARDVTNLVGDGDLTKAAGYIAGEFDVGAKDIERASEAANGVRTIKATDIDEQKRSFLQTAGDVGGSTRDALRTWIGWPIDMGAEAIRDAIGVTEGASVFDDDYLNPEAGIAGGFMDTEEELAEQKERARIRDQTRNLIDKLNREGYVTDAHAKKMKAVTDNYNADTYQDLFEELSTELGDFEYGSVEEARSINDDLNDLRTRSASFMDAKDGTTGSEGGVGDAEPVAEGDDTEGLLDPATINTFDDLLYQSGVISRQQQQGLPGEPDRSTLTDIWVDGQRVSYGATLGTGPDAIQDPATGAIMSNEQYQLIMSTDALKQRYAELGRTEGANARIAEQLASGRYTDIGGGERRTFKPGTGGIPTEDLGIPSLIQGEAWQQPLIDFQVGSGAAQWRGMSSYMRRINIGLMVRTGLIREEDAGDYESGSSFKAVQMWETLNGVQRDLQIDKYTAMQELGVTVADLRSQMAGGGGSGRMAPKYSVPASLRTIPDYKALATETKGIFRNQLNRDMDDYELAFLADEMGKLYGTRNDQLIQAHRAAWDDGVSGGTVNVDDIEVTDPASSLTYDIEESYSDEIERQEDVQDYGRNRQIMMDSITVGQRMI